MDSANNGKGELETRTSRATQRESDPYSSITIPPWTPLPPGHIPPEWYDRNSVRWGPIPEIPSSWGNATSALMTSNHSSTTVTEIQGHTSAKALAPLTRTKKGQGQLLASSTPGIRDFSIQLTRLNQRNSSLRAGSTMVSDVESLAVNRGPIFHSTPNPSSSNAARKPTKKAKRCGEILVNATGCGATAVNSTELIKFQKAKSKCENEKHKKLEEIVHKQCRQIQSFSHDVLKVKNSLAELNHDLTKSVGALNLSQVRLRLNSIQTQVNALVNQHYMTRDEDVSDVSESTSHNIINQSDRFQSLATSSKSIPSISNVSQKRSLETSEESFEEFDNDEDEDSGSSIEFAGQVHWGPISKRSGLRSRAVQQRRENDLDLSAISEQLSNVAVHDKEKSVDMETYENDSERPVSQEQTRRSLSDQDNEGHVYSDEITSLLKNEFAFLYASSNIQTYQKAIKPSKEDVLQNPNTVDEILDEEFCRHYTFKSYETFSFKILKKAEEAKFITPGERPDLLRELDTYFVHTYVNGRPRYCSAFRQHCVDSTAFKEVNQRFWNFYCTRTEGEEFEFTENAWKARPRNVSEKLKSEANPNALRACCICLKPPIGRSVFYDHVNLHTLGAADFTCKVVDCLVFCMNKPKLAEHMRREHPDSD